MKRRDFFRQIMQYSILVGLTSVSGYLIFRKKSEEVCNLDFVCRNCKKNNKCELPEAREFKKKSTL